MNPTIPKKTVNAKIREVLAMASGYGKTEGVILQAVNDLVKRGQVINLVIHTSSSSRTPRIQYPGAIYHVMARGNCRDDIVLGDDDRWMFLHTLGETLQGQRRRRSGTKESRTGYGV